jgi:hypothetical protein
MIGYFSLVPIPATIDLRFLARAFFLLARYVLTLSFLYLGPVYMRSPIGFEPDIFQPNFMSHSDLL